MRLDPPILRFRCTRFESIRLGSGAIYEALESESGEATITRGSGGKKSNSSKLWLSKNDDPSCDECCVVSWEFMGNAVLGPSNTAFFVPRVRDGKGPAFRCGVISGTTGGGAMVDEEVGEEISWI